MKKVLALVLALTMVFCLCACGGGGSTATQAPASGGNTPATQAPAQGGNDDTPDNPPAGNSEMRVAMITDYGDITDQSFNQTTYEACKAFGEANGVDFVYKKPASNSDADRVTMIETAIDEGYNVIVMPGFAFAAAIRDTAGSYPDVTFIALDVGAGDLGDDYTVPSNLYCATYQEELAGYMAGYAAVKLGYKKLGFLGGVAVPAVQRYGYGYVQGADAAAAELGLTDVVVNYVYGGAFEPTTGAKGKMDTWCQGGTEIIFSCGGGIYASAAEAAQSAGKKIIGVDVDQIGIIDSAYGTGITVTSAMKGLAATVQTMLTAVKDGNFSQYGGKIDTLGIVSDTPSENYVQLGTTQWGDGFTEEDYNALVAAMHAGTITVSGDVSKAPADFATVITVDDQGSL